MSRPSRRIEPSVGSIRRSTVRTTVDLPQPDSPTRPSVSCGAIENDTPSTANTTPPERRRKPWRMSKCFLRSRTSSTGGEACPLAEARAVVAVSAIAASEDLVRAPAGGPVARALLLVGREGGAAAVLRIGAARRKNAAGRQVAERRDHAGDLLQPRGRALADAMHDGEARDRGHQAARVGMLRIGEQI